MKHLNFAQYAFLVIGVLALGTLGGFAERTDAVEADDIRAQDVPGIGANLLLDDEVFAQEAQLREEIIAKCMKNQGFDYIPNPPLIVDYHSALDVRELQNPNLAIMDQMSKEDYRAYSQALSGVDDVDNPPPIEEWKRDGGCLMQAHRMVPGLYATNRELVKKAKQIRLNLVSGRVQCDVNGRTVSPEKLDEMVSEGLLALEAAGAAHASCRSTYKGQGLEEKMDKFVLQNKEEIKRLMEDLQEARAGAEAYLRK